MEPLLSTVQDRQRLAALHSFAILDTPSEPAFDRITARLARLLDMPIALITLIDGDRQWFKSCHGVATGGQDLDKAFGTHTIAAPGVLVVEDATQDERFRENPFVTGPFGLRFYAGAPLRTEDGFHLGSLCVVDTKPRALTREQTGLLEDLAAIVVDEFALRRAGAKLQQEIAAREKAQARLEEVMRTMDEKVQARTQELQAAQERYRELFENAVEGMFQTTPEGRYVAANLSLAQLYGFTSPEELMAELTDIEHQLYLDPQRREEFQRQMRETGVVRSFESQVRRRDSSLVWVSEMARAVRDDRGRIVYFEGTVKDITRRKVAEEAVQRSYAEMEDRVRERTRELEQFNGELASAMRENQAYSAALRSSLVGVLITDPSLPDNPTVYVNPAFQRITGYGPEDVIGKNCRFLQGPDSSLERIAEMRAAIAERQPFRGLILNYRKDGAPFWNELAIDPVFNEAGELIHFVGLQNDVTAREEAQAALREAKEEAERANAAKSEFLSRMSHELRTPLNAILGFSQLMQRRSLDARQAESVGYIAKAGRHLLDLVNEVLDLARIESGHTSWSPESVPVVEIVQESIDLVRPLAMERMVELVMAPGLLAAAPLVLADRQRLKQICVNLLSNAIKYNRECGSVTVCAREVGENIALEFVDTGLGIPDEHLGRLFVPFERLSADESAVEGSGIGLALTQRLVTMMGGTIEVQSEAHEGSTFRVLLPRGTVPFSATTPSTDDDAGPGAADGWQTVLYIEDHPANLRLMEHVAAEHGGVRLITTSSGAEAVRLARRHHPALILLDLHLPDVPGDQVLWQLRAQPEFRETPILIVSADAMPKQVSRLLKEGATGYVTKPIEVQEMLSQFHEYLGVPA